MKNENPNLVARLTQTEIENARDRVEKKRGFLWHSCAVDILKAMEQKKLSFALCTLGGFLEHIYEVNFYDGHGDTIDGDEFSVRGGGRFTMDIGARNRENYSQIKSTVERFATIEDELTIVEKDGQIFTTFFLRANVVNTDKRAKDMDDEARASDISQRLKRTRELFGE